VSQKSVSYQNQQISSISLLKDKGFFVIETGSCFLNKKKTNYLNLRLKGICIQVLSCDTLSKVE